MSDRFDSMPALPAVHSAAEPAVAEPRPGVAAELGEIVHDVGQYRDLLYQLTLRDVRIRYKQAVMGFGWAIFMPALIVLSGLLVRLAMSYVSGRPLEASSVAGIVVKAIPWGFFVTAIGFATASLTGNSVLVTKIYFPRELLPIATVLAAAFDALIGIAVIATVLPFLGVQLSAGLLWVPVIALLLFVFTVATSLFLSCANLFFRDVKYIVQALLTFGVFFTPVFFDAAMFGPVAGPAAMLNPLAPLLEGLRLAVVEGHNLLAPLEVVVRGATVLAGSPWSLAYSALWAVGGLFGGALLFHRAEFLFAEYV
jgi:lipopolysaccharide transport system permease protein